jgi:pimeloyl-ACP methyl ester carboxylesterase
VLLLQLAGAAAVLTLLLGQLRTVQEVLGRAADAAGFWPVRDHPLAGASYREAVIAGIEQEAARLGPTRVALVGYSQGSVICAWLVAETPALSDCRELHLVTTGSPLVSLYSAFFPAYFTDGWFGRVADRSTGWANFWRATDPVGTPVPGAVNVELTDPDAAGTVQGHGGYWNAPEVIKHVAAVAAGGRNSPYQHPAGRIDPT